jgi:hypothetical protein
MRAAATVIFFVALGVLGSCSSNDDEGCYGDSDCAPGFVCDDSSGECRASSNGGNHPCTLPTDCAQSYACGEQGRCLPGDCYFNGCVSGFECQSSTGTWECLSSSGAAGAFGTDNSPQAGSRG